MDAIILPVLPAAMSSSGLLPSTLHNFWGLMLNHCPTHCSTTPGTSDSSL